MAAAAAAAAVAAAEVGTRQLSKIELLEQNKVMLQRITGMGADLNLPEVANLYRKLMDQQQELAASLVVTNDVQEVISQHTQRDRVRGDAILLAQIVEIMKLAQDTYATLRLESARVWRKRGELRAGGIELRRLFDEVASKLCAANSREEALKILASTSLKFIDQDRADGPLTDFWGQHARMAKSDQEAANELCKSLRMTRDITDEEGNSVQIGATVAQHTDAEGKKYTTIQSTSDDVTLLSEDIRKMSIKEITKDERVQGKQAAKQYPFCARSPTPNFWLTMMEWHEPNGSQLKRKQKLLKMIQVMPFPPSAKEFMEYNKVSPTGVKFGTLAECETMWVPENIRWIDMVDYERALHPELDNMKDIFEMGQTRAVRSLVDQPLKLQQFWTTLFPLLLWSTKLLKMPSSSRRNHLMSLGRVVYELSWYHALCSGHKACLDMKSMFHVIQDATTRSWSFLATPQRVGDDDRKRDKRGMPILCWEDQMIATPYNTGPTLGSEEARSARCAQMRMMLEWSNIWAYHIEKLRFDCHAAALYRLMRGVCVSYAPAFFRSKNGSSRCLLDFGELCDSMWHDPFHSASPQFQLELHRGAFHCWFEWMIAAGMTVTHFEHLTVEVKQPPPAAAAAAAAATTATAVVAPHKRVIDMQRQWWCVRWTYQTAVLWPEIARAIAFHVAGNVLAVDLSGPLPRPSTYMRTMLEVISEYLIGATSVKRRGDMFGAEWITVSRLRAESQLGVNDAYPANICVHDIDDEKHAEHVKQELAKLMDFTKEHNEGFMHAADMGIGEDSVRAKTKQADRVLADVHRRIEGNSGRARLNQIRAAETAAASAGESNKRKR